VRRKLLRSPEAHPSCLGALPALAGAGTDQRALELGEAAQDGEYELAMRRRRIGPGVLERAEARVGLLDGIEDVEEITGGAC
jgi:hypothetical protein